MAHSLKRFTLAILASLAFAAAAEAQILIVDDERVEREAAAYKDFNLQTNELRNGIVQLRQFIARGGQLEQQLAELEQQKSIIGNDQYEQRRQELQQQFAGAQEQLGRLEVVFDRLRQEAAVQVERARQPVIRQILSDRGAQIIMMKRLVMGHASGMDVTTEFIESLDAELPTVTISLPAPGQQPAPAEGQGEGGN